MLLDFPQPRAFLPHCVCLSVKLQECFVAGSGFDIALYESFQFWLLRKECIDNVIPRAA
jgi:hypothetical protein